MLRLLETIKVEHHRFYHLNYHSRRLNNSRKALFDKHDNLNLASELHIPAGLGPERYKCRVVYGEDIESVEYVPYVLKPVDSLKLVNGANVEYGYKYANRDSLTALHNLRGSCDDVLIAREGFITDTTYANVAFYDGLSWYTPSTVLLEGTCRARLLDEGVLIEAEIRVADLASFQKLALINALIDLGECVIPTSAIVH